MARTGDGVAADRGAGGVHRRPAAPAAAGASADRARYRASARRRHVAHAARHIADAQQAAALDSYLVTVADHGLNASTFAARVVASTQAGLTSAVLAASARSRGRSMAARPARCSRCSTRSARPTMPRLARRGARRRRAPHGLRPPHLSRPRSARRCAEGRRADSWRRPARSRRAPGPGRSGRAAALASLQRKKPDRALETNVEFYTALLLEALGFPRETFTCVFAMGRVGGWLAHAREQALDGRLIRPQSVYVGPIAQAGGLRGPPDPVHSGPRTVGVDGC